MEKTWKIGDIAHVYIGWGEIIEILAGYPQRFVLRFDNGMEGTFPINQLSLD